MTTVAEIVIANPSAARVFERHAVDYCCHGRRSLAEACAGAGADLAQVQGELDALTEGGAKGGLPQTALDSPGALVGHIVAIHHTYLRRELPRLGELMGKVIAAHSAAHPEVLAVSATLEAITADLLPHLSKEEKVLFPLMIELLGAVAPVSFHCGTVANPIRMMGAEHDRVGELLASLRRQTDSYTPPDDACPTWRALYAGLAELEHDVHTHVHLENNVLFPKILALEWSLSP